MIYFRLKRPAQVALIGAALAAPGCYGSHGEEDAHVSDPLPDSMDVPDRLDVRDDGDVFVVDDVPDSREIPDVRDDGYYHDDPPMESWDIPDADDAEPDDFVVDMAPYPNCGDTATATLATTGVEAGTDYGVGEVTINAPAIEPYDTIGCGLSPCVDVVPEGGLGTVSDITMTAERTARFRYSNPAMAYGDVIRLEVRWRLYCMDPGAMREESIVGSAWACRDDAFNIRITGSIGECPSVIDNVPAPMARNGSTTNTPSPDSLALRAAPIPGGAYHLQAVGPEGTRSFRWLASGGKLRMISDAEALFRPDRDAGLCMVQVAAFTRSGVSIQVFRKRRG
jgi:hypothetical protein